MANPKGNPMTTWDTLVTCNRKPDLDMGPWPQGVR